MLNSPFLSNEAGHAKRRAALRARGANAAAEAQTAAFLRGEQPERRISMAISALWPRTRAYSGFWRS
eukprot:scaffold1070_cov245-Pinguiococcus_pyrenoidosus.AAC.41